MALTKKTLYCVKWTMDNSRPKSFSIMVTSVDVKDALLDAIRMENIMLSKMASCEITKEATVWA